MADSSCTISQLDAASIHPEITEFKANYFRSVTDAKNTLKVLVCDSLAINHELFVLTNTTHGLLTLISGLKQEGFELFVGEDCYPPYRVFSGIADGNIDKDKLILETTINPITGKVRDEAKASGSITVADIAQSFATAGFHTRSLQADIFICPLHKHVGVIGGLGLLGIRRSLSMPNLRAIAKVAESGTSSLQVLEHAIARIQSLDGKLINKFALNFTCDDVVSLATKGITLISPIEKALPFAVVQGIGDGEMRQLARGTNFSVKQLKETNALRISGFERGKLSDEIINYASSFIALLNDRRNVGVVNA